jgi:hypothetical protein
MPDVHLLVLIHGMWGNPSHLAHANKVIREVKGGAQASGAELEVLVAETNKDESTYDGIDWGGERVAEEVILLCCHQSRGFSVRKLDSTEDCGPGKGRSEGDSLLCRWLQSWWPRCTLCHWVRAPVPSRVTV